MEKSYTPCPLNTEGIELPDELNTLIEQIAENVHEVWANNRMNQGWKYGKERNDSLKLHPCLVPYEKLPEEEKEYDRNTATETLKLIKKKGFKISKK